MGISPNITFFYISDKEFKNGYSENKIIGFRYYDKGPKILDSKYFTLIKKYDSKYYILEKNEKIIDINDNSFYNPNLDCFSIIYNIIKQKSKNKNFIMNGDTFPEIIGYCYGLMTLKRFKEFICVEPLIPEALNPETFEENIPDELEENITYLEPLICDDHISLIIFSKPTSHRINIILDMSRFHSSTNKLHKSMFPKSVVDQNFKYPEKSIQSYSSSCLWFYGEIETLKNNEKYQSFKSIFKSIREDRVHFYIDIINTISKNFFDIADLFKIEKGKKIFLR